jgi:hypothetical protein
MTPAIGGRFHITNVIEILVSLKFARVCGANIQEMSEKKNTDK